MFENWPYLFLGQWVQKWHQNFSMISCFWHMDYHNFHDIFSFFWTKSEAVLTLWLNKNYVCLKKASSITISNTVRMLKISFQEVLHRYVTMAFLPKCSASCFNLKSVLSLKHFFFYCTGCICENIWYKFYFHHHLPMITSICILCQGRQRKN